VKRDVGHRGILQGAAHALERVANDEPDDVLAHREEVDARLAAAGLSWYAVSNWSRPGGERRHNLGYWDGGQWWGAGPGRTVMSARRAGAMSSTPTLMLRCWLVRRCR
jgi:hypothetical protein